MGFNLEESFYSNIIKVKGDSKPTMNIGISVTHFPCGNVVYSWICIEDEIGKTKRKTALGIARRLVQEAKQRGNTTDILYRGRRVESSWRC